MTACGIRAGLLVLAVTACDLPRDSDGTLDRIHDGTMRVGVVVDTPWTTDSSGVAGGIEGGIVQSLARSLNARVSWKRGQQDYLLTSLQHREIDLVIGGLTADSPWSKQVAFTRPYFTDTVEVAGSSKPRQHVLAASPGENAWLMRIEQLLITYQGLVPREARQAAR
jgi:polar amino acid transport system substrate-binding protein